MTRLMEIFDSNATKMIVKIDTIPPDFAMALPRPMQPAPMRLFVKLNVAADTDDPSDLHDSASPRPCPFSFDSKAVWLDAGTRELAVVWNTDAILEKKHQPASRTTLSSKDNWSFKFGLG